ncbi:MAG: hypothetical protein ACRDLM_10505 [Gaiellaceae bacterium]
MRRLIVLAVLSLGLAACGSSGAPKPAHGTQIEFGIEGGNIAPFDITISPTGKITELGNARITKRHLPSATEASLSSAVQSSFAGLSSRQCKGTLPDVGARFIRAEGKTVTVHGSCETGFEQLWGKLTAAVGFD